MTARRHDGRSRLAGATDRRTPGRADSPSATKDTPSFSADGLVTAPELPMIDAPAECADAWRSATSATGVTDDSAAASRPAPQDGDGRPHDREDGRAGRHDHTGHDRNTPTPQTDASQDNDGAPVRVHTSAARTIAIANVSDTTCAKKKNWKRTQRVGRGIRSRTGAARRRAAQTAPRCPLIVQQSVTASAGRR